MSWLTSPGWQAIAGLCAWSALLIAVGQVCRPHLGPSLEVDPSIGFRAVSGFVVLFFLLVCCIAVQGRNGMQGCI